MRRLVLPLLAAVLIAGACGDASGPAGTAPPPSADATTTTTPPATDSSATDPPATDPPPPAPAAPAAFAPSSGVTRAQPAAGTDTAALAAGLNGAGFDLWHQQPEDGNVVFSPASIGQALLMARPAADAATGAAIDALLALPDDAHPQWNALDQAIAASAGASDDVDVSLAARVWPRAGLQPDQGWIDLLAAEHGVTLESLDFGGDPDGSRDQINQWVADHTEGLIDELVPPGSIEPDTQLALTNALYFAARWASVFGKFPAEPGTFTRLDGSTVGVDFMVHREIRDRSGTGDGFVGAEIPYAGLEFSMLLIVPDEGRFAEVRAALDQELLDQIDATWGQQALELRMPQWQHDTSLDLVGWLAARGIAPGEYPGIAPGVFLDAAAHGADITVDDQGTVAAAATNLAFALSGPPEPELVVAAERPFLYLIRHRPSGLVLFAGQVTDPTAAGS